MLKGGGGRGTTNRYVAAAFEFALSLARVASFDGEERGLVLEVYFTMQLYDKTSHRSRARLRQNVRGLDDDLGDGSDEPLRITPASAPTKRTIPYCSGRLIRSPGFAQARKMVSTTSSGLGASASVFRDGSVHGSYKSFVCVHVVCPISSVSTEKPHANQKWGRKPLRERPSLAKAYGIKGRTIRGRSRVSVPEPNVIKRRRSRRRS